MRKSWAMMCSQGLEKSLAATVTEKLKIKFMKRKKLKLCAKCLSPFTVAQQTHSWRWEQSPYFPSFLS